MSKAGRTRGTRSAGKAASSGWRAHGYLALRALFLAAIVVGFVFFLRGLELSQLVQALGRAKLWPILLAALLVFANLYGKAVCWRVMLARISRVTTFWLFRYTVAAFAASALTPARSGEVLRIWLLKRRDGVPVAVAAAVAIAEKVLGGVAMLILIAPLPWLMPSLPPWVGRAIVILSAGGAVAIGVCWLAAGSANPQSWLGRFAAGLAAMRRPGALGLSLLALVGAWLADLAAVRLVLWAVGIHLPWAAGLVVLLTVNLAIVVPSTPGQVGLLELGAILGLGILGVPREPALAFALLYHGMQVVPLVLVALADARFILAARKATQEDGAGDSTNGAPGDTRA